MNALQSSTTTNNLRNPFICGSPIHDPDKFIGRRTEVERVFSHLRSGRSVSVVGERRTGKTSLLRYVSQPEVCARHGFSAKSATFAFIDCLALEREEIETVFWKAILTEVKAQFAKISFAPIPIPDPTDMQFNRQALKEFFDGVAASSHRIVLLLDEIDSLNHYSEAVSNNLFGFLRSLASDHKLLLITATREDLEECCKSEKGASPFFNIFFKIQPSYFSQREHTQLVNSYLRLNKSKFDFDKRERKKIAHLTGCHPCFLQMAYYYLFAAYQDKSLNSNQRLDYVHHNLETEMESHLKYYWEHSSPEETQILQKLTKRRQGARGAVKSLVQRCLVIEKCKRYSVFSPIFAAWINNKGDAPQPPSPPPIHWRHYVLFGLVILPIALALIGWFAQTPLDDWFRHVMTLLAAAGALFWFFTGGLEDIGWFTKAVSEWWNKIQMYLVGFVVVVCVIVLLLVLAFEPDWLSYLLPSIERIIN